MERIAIAWYAIKMGGRDTFAGDAGKPAEAPGAEEKPAGTCATDEKDSRNSPNQERSGPRSALWFALKAASATIGGALLTLCVTLAQTHYTRYWETLQRQGDQGITLQQALFRATGAIENEIINVSDWVDNNPEQRPRPDLTANLRRMTNEWRLDRLWYRIRGAQIYGIGVGNRIYDPREESIDVDKCGVETRADALDRDRNCAARVRADVARLRSLVARLKADRGAGREIVMLPAGFQANFRMARKVLDAYLGCWAEDAAPCEQGAIREILDLRIDLMVLAREALSSEIMRRSALRD